MKFPAGIPGLWSRHEWGVLLAMLLLIPVVAGCIGTEDRAGTASNGSGLAPTVGDEAHPGVADRPHVHDRWDGRDSVVLVNRTVRTDNLTEPWEDPMGPSPACEFPCGDRITVIPRTGRLVPPGTARVGAVATWDAEDMAAEHTRVHLAYLPANGSAFQGMGPRPSGQAWVINTSVEMADDGHARQSLWAFRLTVTSALEAAGYSQRIPALAMESMEIHLRIVAHRVPGALPREPAHPDHWGDGPRRDLGNFNGSEDAAGIALVGLDRSGTIPQLVAGTDAGPEIAITGEEHGIVPPGASRLVMNVSWSNDSPAAGEAPVRPYVWYSDRGPYVPEEPWEPEQVGDGRAKFVLPLAEDQWDGMYANRSRWVFTVVFKGDDTGQDAPFEGWDVTGPYAFEGRWEIDVSAYNTTRPS